MIAPYPQNKDFLEPDGNGNYPLSPDRQESWYDRRDLEPDIPGHPFYPDETQGGFPVNDDGSAWAASPQNDPIFFDGNIYQLFPSGAIYSLNFTGADVTYNDPPQLQDTFGYIEAHRQFDGPDPNVWEISDLPLLNVALPDGGLYPDGIWRLTSLPGGLRIGPLYIGDQDAIQLADFQCLPETSGDITWRSFIDPFGEFEVLRAWTTQEVRMRVYLKYMSFTWYYTTRRVTMPGIVPLLTGAGLLAAMMTGSVTQIAMSAAAAKHRRPHEL